ncbi:MAG: RNA pseudouridine synthase [Phycisphaerae bacterium]|nr:RNA pseudouridine synthase [Phycisphaerae bacterium]|tara:strand:+ start:359 stop:997 length:639 start_codon:yes stop_codon:yes gene_type:complete
MAQSPEVPPVIFADNKLIVFEKPTSLLSVPGIGPEKADCLVARAQADFPGARIVHRLDRDTSGLIVLARDADTHRELSRQFQDREVEKTYEAIAGGILAIDEGMIDAAIRKDMDNPPRQMIDDVQGRPSKTRWMVMERGDDCTRIQLFPLTGRSHQLRLHLQSIGHPILGDDLYAPDEMRARVDRLMLHATILEFTHPSSGKRLIFESPAPF